MTAKCFAADPLQCSLSCCAARLEALSQLGCSDPAVGEHLEALNPAFPWPTPGFLIQIKDWKTHKQIKRAINDLTSPWKRHACLGSCLLLLLRLAKRFRDLLRSASGVGMGHWYYI